jgi:uncharacterized heparinase superfamily protein
MDFSMAAHAGCLSFEMSVGRQRLIINCGVPMPGQLSLRRLARTTAAHSTVTLNDTSSCRFLTRSWVGEWLGEAIVAGPTKVDVERGMESGGTVLAMRHNGYVDRFGLAHERKLNLAESGDRLDGVDSFVSPSGKLAGRAGRDAFAIRFHLHPNVRATRSEGGRSVVMELPDGETWEFQADGLEAELEESILLSNTRANRKTVQIIVHGRVQQNASVAWQMHRTAVGGRRQRLLTSAETPAGRLPART